MARLYLVLALPVLVSAGCSSKTPFTSKREALERKLSALEQARKTAATFQSERDQPRMDDVEPVVHGEAPFEPANTLVMQDTEIEQLGVVPNCSRTARGCHSSGFGAGNLCALDAASVLKFGHFRDEDAPYARESAARCAEWLQKLKYVLVVHIDQRSSERAVDNRDKVETYARGYAVLVDFDSGRGLARLPFETESRGTLSGPLERNQERRDPALPPTTVQYINKYATPVDTLVPIVLEKKLREAFPRANVTRWPTIQPKAS